MTAVGVAVAAVALIISGCSDSGATSAEEPSTTTSVAGTDAGTSQAVGWEAPACDRDTPIHPTQLPVEGSESDFDVTSFDGTTIRGTLVPTVHVGHDPTQAPIGPGSDSSAPTVLMGPGWSQPGDVDTSADNADGTMSVLSINGAVGGGLQRVDLGSERFR